MHPTRIWETKDYRLFGPIRRKSCDVHVQSNESEKKKEAVPNNDSNYHLIVDLSEPQPQTENQTTEESVHLIFAR